MNKNNILYNYCQKKYNNGVLIIAFSPVLYGHHSSFESEFAKQKTYLTTDEEDNAYDNYDFLFIYDDRRISTDNVSNLSYFCDDTVETNYNTILSIIDEYREKYSYIYLYGHTFSLTMMNKVALQYNYEYCCVNPRNILSEIIIKRINALYSFTTLSSQNFVIFETASSSLGTFYIMPNSSLYNFAPVTASSFISLATERKYRLTIMDKCSFNLHHFLNEVVDLKLKNTLVDVYCTGKFQILKPFLKDIKLSELGILEVYEFTELIPDEPVHCKMIGSIFHRTLEANGLFKGLYEKQNRIDVYEQDEYH